MLGREPPGHAYGRVWLIGLFGNCGRGILGHFPFCGEPRFVCRRPSSPPVSHDPAISSAPLSAPPSPPINPQGENVVASSVLFPLVYQELRRIAASRLAGESGVQTLQPTALVHEAWLQLAGKKDRLWDNRAHFFGAAADAMRRILIDKARRKSRLKHGGGQTRLDINDLELAGLSPDDTVLLVNEAVEKLEQESPEQARVVVLKFFGGLSNLEVAENLGIGERSVERQWACAKARLFRWVRGARD